MLSDMVIQQVEAPDGPPLLAFNGTTEWALDSLEAHAGALECPREDQLRELLGPVLREPRAGARPARGVRRDRRCLSPPSDVTAEAAYARALLAVLHRRVT